MKRTKMYPILTVLAMLVLASLACSLLSGGKNNGNNTGGNATETEAPAGDDQGDAAATPEESTSGSESGGETGNLSDVKEGLDALDSYSMTYSLSIDGKDADGNPKSGKIQIFEEINRSKNQQHTHFSTEGDAMGESASMGNFDIYVIDNMTFMYGANGDEAPSCMGFSDGEEPAQVDSMEMENLLGGVENAKLVKRGDTVNGMKVDHYQFDQSSLLFGSFDSASGEYWIDEATGVVVRYVGTAQGKYTQFGGDLDGTLTWEYGLDNINKGVEITLPAECESQKPATDIPVPSNATEQSSVAGMITFKSPDTTDVVAEFYKTELPNQGWTAADDSSMEGLVMIGYTKDNRRIDIMITAEDSGGSSVMITETTN